MKKSRIFLTRTILGILAGLFLSTGILASPVQAAGISYQKAVRMYNNKMRDWARRGVRVNINYDLRSRSGWKYNDCGKKFSMKTVYYDDNLRYIYRDVTGDNVPEAFYYSERARVMLVWTIYRGQVQLVGAMRTSYFGPQKLLYNKKEKTFIVKTLITGRSVSRNIFKIKGRTLYINLTMSDYVGQRQSNGRIKVNYWIDGRSVSKSRYQSYYNAYFRYHAAYSWGP